MDQKTAELLQRLADRVGSTATQLWAQFVHYVFVDGLVATGMALLVAVLSVAAFRLVWQMTDGPEDDPHEYAKFEVRMLSVAVAGILALILIIILSDNLPAVFAPEGSAVEKILAKAK